MLIFVAGVGLRRNPTPDFTLDKVLEPTHRTLGRYAGPSVPRRDCVASKMGIGLARANR